MWIPTLPGLQPHINVAMLPHCNACTTKNKNPPVAAMHVQGFDVPTAGSGGSAGSGGDGGKDPHWNGEEIKKLLADAARKATVHIPAHDSWTVEHGVDFGVGAGDADGELATAARAGLPFPQAYSSSAEMSLREQGYCPAYRLNPLHLHCSLHACMLSNA